jgi:hypothetical protein
METSCVHEESARHPCFEAHVKARSVQTPITVSTDGMRKKNKNNVSNFIGLFQPRENYNDRASSPGKLKTFQLKSRSAITWNFWSEARKNRTCNLLSGPGNCNWHLMWCYFTSLGAPQICWWRIGRCRPELGKRFACRLHTLLRSDAEH